MEPSGAAEKPTPRDAARPLDPGALAPGSRHEAEFGLLVHPLDMEDVAERYALAEKVPAKLTAEIVRHWPPFVASRVTGPMSSETGRSLEGVLGVVPLLPEHFEELDDEVLKDKIVRGCKMCARHGARIVGLGGLLAVAGRGGRGVAEYMRVAVTTGSSYTVAVAIAAVRRAVADMGIDAASATLAVLGATSQVGRTCSILLSRRFARCLLVGRDRMRLSAMKPEIESAAGSADVEVRTDVIRAVAEADVVMIASPTASDILKPEDAKQGAVICDVVRPRRAKALFSGARDDVLVIDGGLVKVPGGFDTDLDLGLGKGVALASMAEPVILAMEERFDDYTLGKEVAVERVLEIDRLATKHGFRFAALRAGGLPVPPAAVAAIRARAGR